jgi:hypothetical protein
MPRGGARPGAGRKLDPEVAEFRQWLRKYFNSKKGRAALLKRMNFSDAVFAQALRLAMPAPVSLEVEPDSGPLVVRVIREEKFPARDHTAAPRVPCGTEAPAGDQPTVARDGGDRRPAVGKDVLRRERSRR